MVLGVPKTGFGFVGTLTGKSPSASQTGGGAEGQAAPVPLWIARVVASL